MRAIDLFAGAGGFTAGAAQAGARIVWAANHWDLAVEIHKKNHPETLHALQDLNQADWREVPSMDLVLASPACVPSDALVELADGRQARADEVELGDLVLTDKGRGRPIVNVWKKKFSGRMISFRIWGDSKHDLRMTEDHLVLVRRRPRAGASLGLESAFVRADQVRVGDYVAFPRIESEAGTAERFVQSLAPARIEYAVAAQEVHRKNGTHSRRACVSSMPGCKVLLDGRDEDLWWLVGHYVGDGELRSDGRDEVTWSTGKSSANLERVRSILARFGLSSWVRDIDSNARVTASSSHLRRICAAFGRYCHEKFVPPELARLEPKFAAAFIDGYLDADGCDRIVHGKPVFRATSTSLHLLQGIQRLCWSLGWSAAVAVGDYEREGEIEGRKVHCRDSWEIVIRKEPHKQSRTKFDLEDERLWRSVRSVESTEVKDVDVFDFEVEEDHTFCLPGVVVHNCQGHSQAASAVGKNKRGKAPMHDALRSTAWAVVSCVEVHEPPAVLVENVPEFRNWRLYRTWRQALETLGYAVHEHVFDAADFGVPQNRKRLFISAVKGKKPLILEAPLKPRLVGFESCIDLSAGGWEPVSKKPIAVRQRVAKGRKNFPKGMFLSQHVTGHGGRSLDRPIWTITTKHQAAIVREGPREDEMRMLTVDEYRCGMGFPDDYWLPQNRTCDSVKLLGNAVCPPVARDLVKQIKERV